MLDDGTILLIDPKGKGQELKPMALCYRKENLGTTMDIKSIVIGLGPPYCGKDVRAVIETNGSFLGRDYTIKAIPNTGVPGRSRIWEKGF